MDAVGNLCYIITESLCVLWKTHMRYIKRDQKRRVAYVL